MPREKYYNRLEKKLVTFFIPKTQFARLLEGTMEKYVFDCFSLEHLIKKTMVDLYVHVNLHRLPKKMRFQTIELKRGSEAERHLNPNATARLYFTSLYAFTFL